ncbi:MAG: hypothetical protein ACP5IC_02515 [Minisyncoccia bacterium]
MESVYENEKIRDFVQALQDINANKVDMIVPASSLVIDNNILKIKDRDFSFKILPWAKRQLAGKLQIPMRFYNRLEMNYSNLLNTLLNTMLSKNQDKFLIRTLNGEVRGILSDRYKAYESFDIFTTVIDYAMKLNPNVIFKSAYVTDLFVELELIDKDKKYEIEINGKPDTYYTGVSVINSEVGYRAFEINVLLYRQVCSNGLIAPALNQKIRKIHVGRRITDENYWNDTVINENKLLLNKINDMLNIASNKDNITELLQRLSGYSKQPIDVSVKFLDASQRVLGLNDNEKELIWKNLEEKTRFGFINAITRTAQYYTTIVKKPTERLRLEEIAGEMLTNEYYWREIEREMLRERRRKNKVE